MILVVDQAVTVMVSGLAIISWGVLSEVSQK
jgi:hypothetical protein